MANKTLIWDFANLKSCWWLESWVGGYTKNLVWLFDARAIFPSKINEHMLYPWLFDGFHPMNVDTCPRFVQRERERIAWCEGWFLDSFVKGDGNLLEEFFKTDIQNPQRFSMEVILQAWHVSLAVIWIIDSWRFLFQTISRPVPIGSSHVWRMKRLTPIMVWTFGLVNDNG